MTIGRRLEEDPANGIIHCHRNDYADGYALQYIVHFCFLNAAAICLFSLAGVSVSGNSLKSSRS